MADKLDTESLLGPGWAAVALKTRASIGRTVGDFLFVCLIITPSVLLFWRSTWSLLEDHLPGDDSVRPWLPLAIGSPVVLLVGFLQRHFVQVGRWIIDKDYRLYRLFLGVYGYVVGCATIAQWVAFWNLPVYYLPEIDNAIGNGVLAIVSFISMVISRTVRQGRACPASATFDCDPEPFRIPLRFRTERAESFSWKFVLDVVISLFVLDFITVQNWAGTWRLLDHTIFPDDPCFSSWISVGIGYAIHLLVSFVQFPLQQASKNLAAGRWEFYERLAIEDSFGLLENFGVNNVWRGLWGVYDCYILCNQHLVSVWLAHGLGAGLCLLVCAGSSLAMGQIGVSVDGEADDGTGVLLLHNTEGLPCLQHAHNGHGEESNNPYLADDITAGYCVYF